MEAIKKVYFILMVEAMYFYKKESLRSTSFKQDFRREFELKSVLESAVEDKARSRCIPLGCMVIFH